MDTELLVENRIDEGHRLLIEFVRTGLDVTAAAWLNTSEEGRWFLFVGSATVDAGSVGNAYQIVYACLQRISALSVEMSQVKLLPTSSPIARELAAIRDRYPGGRLPTRYGGRRIGDVAINEAYIYPRVSPGMTRDEVIHTIVGLMNRTGVARPSTVTLRDGTVIRGIPYGIEMSTNPGQQAGVEIKVRDAADNAPRTVLVDEVANIQ